MDPRLAKRRMSTGRVLLIVFGVLLLGGLVWVVGIALWVYYYGSDFVEGTKETLQEGAAFGRLRPAQACVDESLERVKRCAGWQFHCRFEAQFFLHGCLTRSRRLAEFCIDVPAPVHVVESYSHRVETCRAHGQAGKQGCFQLVQEVQAVCEQQRHEPATSSIDGRR